jgi:hypothetical protein
MYFIFILDFQGNALLWPMGACAIYKALEMENAEDEEPPKKPLVINSAGVTCHAWSNEGHQEQFAHSSEVDHEVWVAERNVRGARGEEHLAFVECTPKYPYQQKLVEKLPGHTVISITTGPEEHGYPTKRRRLQAACLNNQVLKWIGPADYATDFKERFHKANILGGRSLFLASDDEVFKEYSELALTQKNRISPEKMKILAKDVLLELTRPPSVLAHLADWQAIIAEQGAVDKDKSFMVDLEHNVLGPHLIGTNSIGT